MEAVKMKKHAYLIIAHKQENLLKKLIRMLDDERNDIFIHVDKNTKTFDFESVKTAATKATVTFTKRVKIAWAGDSQIQSEVVLLEEARAYGMQHYSCGYSYYHLLSGADLPIQSQDYIHEFCENLNGKSMVFFGTAEFNQAIKNRYDKYYLLQNQIGRNTVFNPLLGIENISLAIQKLLRIDRSKKIPFSVYGGCNWFSITDEAAEFVLTHMPEVWKYFRHTRCADELFLQTLFMMSPLQNKIFQPALTGDYASCMRLIDWERGRPYVYQENDLQELQDSKMLFARKFDLEIDAEIVERLYKRYVI